MAEAVLSFFVQKLGEQLVHEVELLTGVHDDVVWIRNELQTMRAFLKDADRRKDREELVEAWITQVRYSVFNAEDAVDEFMIRMDSQCRLRNGHMGCFVFHACFIERLIFRHRFSTQIQKIRKEVKEIQERGDRFGFHTAFQEGKSSIATDNGHRDPGIAAYWVEEADIMGLENDTMKLEKLLLEKEETQQRTIISIVGMGGSGKTTLAKKIYKTAKTSFDCHAWIYVSQSFQKKDILKRILEGFYKSRKEVAPNHGETMDETNIAEMINDYLQGKRYALFLDDIWDTSVWEDVKHALPHEGGSKIIFTTRIENTARPVHEKCSIHRVEPLSHELSWELFQKKAFMKQDTQGTCPPHLVEVGNAMVKRCKGLPLAIVVIGGLMSKKSTDPAEWNDVLENLCWELKDNEDLARLNRALLTSYNYLPFYLKYCFLYCGLFPGDYVIKRKKLICMWVAEGFIKEHQQKTPEEVSSNYFAQLIDRNLLQPVIDEYTGDLIACQVHDLMRDIAIHMLKKEEFAAILTNRRNNFEEAQRRLAIQNTAIDIPGSMRELNPRSILLFNDQEFPSSSFCRMFSKFKLLRVLDLEGTKIKILPNEVGGLIHLRYLSLRRTQIEELPVSLQRLHNLQTLDVRDSHLKGLPTGIEMLTKLRHLKLMKFSKRSEFYKMPKQTASLSNLQTLSGASVDSGFSRELGNLTQLKGLSIGDVKGEDCRQLCDSISQLKWLRSLKIAGQGQDEELNLQELSELIYLEKLYLVCVMKEFPQWVGSHNCLRGIILTNSQFVKDPLITLGQLPNLVVLSLNNAYVGKQICCTSDGFPKLKSMAFIGMKDLEEWSRIEEGTMKSLQHLFIVSCPKLKMLPDGFQHLAAIQLLIFNGMSEEFIKRVRRGGDDHFKVRHIPKIIAIGEDGNQESVWDGEKN
ncbi:disease resistance protein RPM1-like [Magnolia sinica]|uniref:disease resistance protein RPM1-like n=1 Tax=Magnolia sinica TaxID=86752 RepID=UPI002658977B|nr:disease resistance protein RPM1-like [Magnolia sinica]XP_058114731.1 disease resistance protein RPM1-like [Magnolia sinica]XP_058114732.1 disease resistance protein RPM1-like [Magnolia sinica]